MSCMTHVADTLFVRVEGGVIEISLGSTIYKLRVTDLQGLREFGREHRHHLTAIEFGSEFYFPEEHGASTDECRRAIEALGFEFDEERFGYDCDEIEGSASPDS